MAATAELTIDLLLAAGGEANEITGVSARVEELTLEQNAEQDQQDAAAAISGKKETNCCPL